MSNIDKLARAVAVSGALSRAQTAKQPKSLGRKRIPKVKMDQVPWDHGADGPANQRGLIVEERGEVDSKSGRTVNPNGVTGKRRVDMLEIYHKRGWISTRGYNAGELLRIVWLRTEMGTCAPWLRERVNSSPKPDAAISIHIDRMSALLHTSRMVAPEDKRIIDCVCYSGAGIGQLREYRGRNHDKGKLHLQEALDRLAGRIEGLARKTKGV